MVVESPIICHALNFSLNSRMAIFYLLTTLGYVNYIHFTTGRVFKPLHMPILCLSVFNVNKYLTNYMFLNPFSSYFITLTQTVSPWRVLSVFSKCLIGSSLPLFMLCMLSEHRLLYLLGPLPLGQPLTVVGIRMLKCLLIMDLDCALDLKFRLVFLFIKNI